MGYICTELSLLKSRSETSMYARTANDDNTNLDLMTISDLHFYVSELNKNNDAVDEEIKEELLKWELSEKDIEICSNFHTYSKKFQQRLFKNPSLVKKIVDYANVLSGKTIIDNDNENNIQVISKSSIDQDMVTSKKVLDNRGERCKLYREAWLRKTYNEIGLEDKEERVKFNRYYLEHMKRNRISK